MVQVMTAQGSTRSFGRLSGSYDFGALVSRQPAMSFGDFMVRPAERAVLFHGKPVEIGSRAFDLLVVLLRSSGEIVTKQEIMRHVWPSTIVDEGNLRFQMAMLRRALGRERDRIKTVTGRGYLFVPDSEEFSRLQLRR